MQLHLSLLVRPCFWALTVAMWAVSGEHKLLVFALPAGSVAPGRRDRRGERFTVLSQNAGPAGETLPFSPGSPAFLGWDPRHSVVLREEDEK